jgi:hypothetical protein
MQALLRCAAAALALAVWAPPAGASTIVTLEVDLGNSTVTFETGDVEPIQGTITLAIGSLPVGSSNTTFDVVDLDLQWVQTLTLDPSVANPGLGVLTPEGAFLIPTLFLAILGYDDSIAIPDIAGNVEFSPDGSSIRRLEVAFDLLSEEVGLVQIVLVAVPEPATIGLFAAGLAALAMRRARREGAR